MTLEELRKAHKTQDRIAVIATIFIVAIIGGLAFRGL